MRIIKDLSDSYKEYRRTKASFGMPADKNIITVGGKTIVYADEIAKRATVKAIKIDEPFTVETGNPCNKGEKGDYNCINEHGVLCEADAEHFEKSYELV